jgi:small subunit ribosomal protein S1
VGQLVYGRVTKLVQFGAFVQVGDGIEGLVHISEMSAHHVDSPEQVVTPGEELWVKIIDLDLARRRISLSIKQAAEGGELAAEYREHFEVDASGNWVAGETDAEAEAAWSEYYSATGEGVEGAESAAPADAPAGEAPVAETPVADEAPVAEASIAEAPVAEAPVAETPVDDDAAVDDPTADTADVTAD